MILIVYGSTAVFITQGNYIGMFGTLPIKINVCAAPLYFGF